MSRTPRALLVAAAVAALGLVNIGTAQASNAPAQMYAKHSAYSESAIKFQWHRTSDDALYFDNILPGQTEGEGWPQNAGAEPYAFFTGYGWCVDWRVGNGTWDTIDARNAPNGLWQNVYPGIGATGTWFVQTYSYNC